MVVVIRNEKHREMPVLFTGRNIIQIQQTSAETVPFLFQGKKRDFL